MPIWLDCQYYNEIYIYIYIHTYVYTHIHTYTYIYIYIDCQYDYMKNIYFPKFDVWNKTSNYKHDFSSIYFCSCLSCKTSTG